MCWVSREVFVRTLRLWAILFFCTVLEGNHQLWHLNNKRWMGNLFLICIFRVKYTFFLLLLMYNQRTTLWKLYHIWKTQHFPLTGDFCTKKKKKNLRPFCCSFAITALHCVVFIVTEGTCWQRQVQPSYSNVCCYDANGYWLRQKLDPYYCILWILF